MELPEDAAQHLAVVPPGLAPPGVGGQQRVHVGEGLVSELQHRGCSWLVGVSSATLSAGTTTSSQVRLQY
jgi:hypothetical protein